jgi:hypothetical protein
MPSFYYVFLKIICYLPLSYQHSVDGNMSDYFHRDKIFYLYEQNVYPSVIHPVTETRGHNFSSSGGLNLPPYSQFS